MTFTWKCVALAPCLLIKYKIVSLACFISSGSKRPFKGCLISESFSLWLFPQTNVPDQYTQLSFKGLKVEDSDLAQLFEETTDVKTFWD